MSLEDLAPPPLDIPDDPRILYPVAMLPAVESAESTEEGKLDAQTITTCLNKLQSTTIV